MTHASCGEGCRGRSVFQAASTKARAATAGHDQGVRRFHGPQRRSADRAPDDRDDQKLPVRPMRRDQNTQRRDHGRIGRNTEQLDLQPRPAGERTDQRKYKKREQKDAKSGQAEQIPARPEAEPIADNPAPRQQERLDRKPDGDVFGGPVDGLITFQEIGPRDPEPASRQHRGDRTAPPDAPAQQQAEDRHAQREAHQLQRPYGHVVELEQPVVGARREQQKVRQRIRPPFGHQSFSTWAAMRLRRPSSGMRPWAAPRFSRTWSTRVVAGIAQVTAGCETMNLRTICAQLLQPISVAQPGSGWRCSFFVSSPSRNGRLTMTAMPRSRRQRQDAVFDLAVEDVVGHLHEIERLRAHDLLDVAMAASFRGGDPDIADLAGRFHGEQRFQVLFPRQQIVHLQQIEARHAPVSARGFDLAGAAAARGDPDLFGREQARRLLQLVEAISDHLLRRPVHRRQVDHAPAILEEGPHDLRAGIARDDVIADIECDPGAEPDHGHCLAARRYRLGEDRALLRRREARIQHRGRAGRGKRTKQAATTEAWDVLHRVQSVL